MGLLGKLTPPQIVLNSVLFNFAWNLNHFLCARLQQISPDRRLFDDYQISSVYLFASSFGIVVSLLIKKPMLTRYFRHSNMSIIFAQIGTFFLFLAFCSTTTFLSLKFSKPASGEYSRSYVWQEAFLGTFFALSASVIATYIFSILLSETRRIGIRESILGTIMGAIMYGPVAGTCTNIGAAIACGIFAGFLSAIFYQKVYPKINEVAVRDSLGLLNIWVVSFLATFVISPIVIRTYYNYTVNLTTF
jgi:ammonium transporter Rh